MKNKEEEEVENCVSCGKKTDIEKRMNIDFRRGYIEGVGQLCAECAQKFDNPGPEGFRLPHPTKGAVVEQKDDSLFMFGPDAMP